jgi:hypothetical protein
MHARGSDVNCCRNSRHEAIGSWKGMSHVCKHAVSFPTTDLIENIQILYEIHSVLLPIYTVATAVKAMCKCCGRVIAMRFESSFTVFCVK